MGPLLPSKALALGAVLVGVPRRAGVLGAVPIALPIWVWDEPDKSPTPPVPGLAPPGGRRAVGTWPGPGPLHAPGILSTHMLTSPVSFLTRLGLPLD